MPRERDTKKTERKSFRGEFSFVNKDASNIDSKEHNAHVSWHVVNRYERWKRQEKAQLPGAAASSGDMMQMSSSYGLSFVRKRKKSYPRSVLTNRQPGGEESSFASYPPSPWNVDRAEQTMLESTSMSSPYRHEQADSLDLSSADLALTNEPWLGSHDAYTVQSFIASLQSAQFPPLIARILCYSAEIIVPILWPEAVSKEKWQYEISRTLGDLIAISVDPCYGSATLCYYATVMASMTGDSDIASQACFFQVQAMTELQQRIQPQSGGYSSFILKAILRLFSAETVLDNTSTARVHLKMLRNIITLEGGVILLDAWFRENLLSADSYFALKYETRPLFPASEWTPGPLSQAWKTKIASARLIGDHAPTVGPAVDGVLKSIILDLRELFRVQWYVDSFGISAEDQLLRWRQLRKFDCLSRLADHQLSVKIYPHLFDRSKLQSAVCAGVALLSAMVLGGPEPLRFDLKLTYDLRDRIINARAELEHETHETASADELDSGRVMYWLLYIGRLSERCHTIPAIMLWFDDELQAAAKHLGLQNPADCFAINKQFLFSQSLVEEIEAEHSKQRTGSIHGVYEACGTSWRSPDILTED